MYKKLPLKHDFEFDILQIENFNNSLQFDYYFNFIKKNFNKLKGDIYEFGVYKGKSLISTALLLKKLKSKKKIYGFDSFSGFPSFDKYDYINYFDRLYKRKKISTNQYKLIKLNRLITTKLSKKTNQPGQISTSEKFSKTSLRNLKKKIRSLGLDNIILVKGNFNKTVSKHFNSKKKRKIFACNLDCDLYSGYKVTLPKIWKNLVPNGIIHLDEYYSLKFPGAKVACDNFFTKKKIKPFNVQNKKSQFERWYVKKIK